MDLDTLNEVSESEFLPRKKCTELEKNKQYMVTALKRVVTRYGSKVVAELDDICQIFLPGKISSAMLKDE